MTNILTLEQDIELGEAQAIASPIRRKKASIHSDEDVENEIAKNRMRDVAFNRDDVGASHIDKLKHDVNTGLAIYLKKMPQYKIIDTQLNLLENELKTYQKNGSVENVEKTKAIIEELKSKMKELKHIFKKGESSNAAKTTEEKNELNDKIRNSEKLNLLTAEKKLLKKQLEEATVSWWMKHLISYRKRIELYKFHNKEEIIDFDDLIETDLNKTIKNSELEQEYHDFCGRIADILDWTVQDVLESKNSQIQKVLTDVLPVTWEIKNRIEQVNAEISFERDTISNSTKITDLIFEVFDFEKPEDVKISKEILGLSNISYANSISYKMCEKAGLLNTKKEDALSAGLEGLALALDRWFNKQIKLSGSPTSFKAFAQITIAQTVQRELYNLSGMGSASGSTIADNNHWNKKKVNNFIKDNKQFADVDPSIVMELLAAYEESGEIKTGVKLNSKISTATEYSEIIGGGDEEGSTDIFDNATNAEDNISEFLEGKLAYEKMLKSISDILGMFEMSTDKRTGITRITDKKLFDKYDRKIFMMYFGLQHKIEKTYDDNGNEITRNEYTQNEIANELFLLMKSDGHVLDKPFSQAAIKYRIDSILLKIKRALELQPDLKSGFEYFINIRHSDGDIENKPNEKAGNWRLNNPDLLKTLSNSREEIGMKIDREDLREIYAGNQRAMKTQLSDGKRLSDVFEISDSNPLDEEINAMFGEF